MKRIIIIVTAVSILLSVQSIFNKSHAQSIELIGDSYVYGNPAMPVASHIIVKNITSDTLQVMCQKIIIDTTTGTQNYFCWGTSCWPSSTYISPVPAGVRAIPPGYADSTNFTGYYDAFGKQVRAIVKYCFYPQGNSADSTCLTVHYNDNLSTTTEVSRKAGLNDFYPNPAENKTTIKYIADKNSQFHIIDILGNKLKTYKLDLSGFIDVNTSELGSGIYFGNLVVNDKVVAVKKLIIN